MQIGHAASWAGAIGAANYMTAAICKMTGNQPASACAAPAIRSLQAKL
jgi:hypothetical protein